MRRKTWTTAAWALPIATLLSAAPPVGAQSQNLTILPGAAEIDGVAGARFSSTLNLSNPGTSPATITIGLIPQPGKSAPAPVTRTLAPGESRRIPAVLTALFGLTSDAGALTITGETAVVSNLNTQNVADPSGTYGVGFSPVLESGLLSPGQTGHAIWLSQSAGLSGGSRTNVAVVLVDPNSSVQVRVFDAAGALRGQATVASPTPVSWQVRASNLIGAAPLDVGRVAFAVTAGRATGYTAVDDNITSDAIAAQAVRVGDGPVDQLLDGAAKTAGVGGSFWTTDVRVFNPGTGPVDVRIDALGFLTATTPLTRTLLPGTVLALPNILESFGLPDGAAGALRVRAPSPVLLAARTNNTDPSGLRPGSFSGQILPRRLPDDLLGAGMTGTFIGIGQTFDVPGTRTNLAILGGETGASGTLVLRDAFGAEQASTPFTRGPFEWGQRNVADWFPSAALLRTGTRTPLVTVPEGSRIDLVVATGAVDSYVSFVDNGSGDAITQPPASSCGVPPFAVEPFLVAPASPVAGQAATLSWGYTSANGNVSQQTLAESEKGTILLSNQDRSASLTFTQPGPHTAVLEGRLGCRTVSRQIAYTVACPVITVAPTTLASGHVGTPYPPVAFTQTGGIGAVTWTSAGALPAGMTFSPAGSLSGTPTVSGTFPVTFTATDSRGCAGHVTINLVVCATLTLNITPTPSPVCSGSGGNTATATGGYASYSWSITNGTITSATNTQTITYTAGASGNVTLTVNVTNGASCPGQATLIVPINPLPAAPTITPVPTQVCAASTGNTASGPAGAATYDWSITNGTITSATNVQTITYTAGASGTVGLTLTVTNASGCSAQNFWSVTIKPAPATPAITPAPANVCANSTGNTASGPAGASSYSWSITNGTITSATNIQTITYTAGASGSVGLTLTVTNASGCSAQATSNVPINPLPAIPTITPSPAQVCANSTGNTASGPAGATTYSWSITNGTITSATNIQTITYTAGASGSVGLTLTVTNGNGCSAQATSNVPINPLPATPTITPGGPTTFCTGGSVTLTSSSVTGNQWYLNGNPIGGATNQTYAATASGSYTVVVTTLGCASLPSTATAVTVNPTPATPTITPGGPTTFCAGGSVTLTSSSATGNQWYLNGNPIGGATNPTYVANASGNYTVVLTALGCPSSPSAATAVTVTSPPTPTITPGGATTFCAGGSVTLTSSSATGNQWYLNGNPIGGATNPTYVANASGSYSVVVTILGCLSSPSAAVPVTVNPAPATPTIATSNPQTFTVTGASGSFTLTFNGQTTGALAFNATAATVQAALNALSSIGGVGGSVVVSQAVTVYTVAFGGTLAGPQPLLTASGFGGTSVVVGPPTVCGDSTGNLASGPAGATTYSWSITNGTITSLTNIQTITYTAGTSGTVGLTLTVTNPAGCPAQNSASLTILASPATPTITPTPAQLCANSTGNTASGPAGATTYAWSITNGTITLGGSSQTVTYTAGPSGNVGLTLTVTNPAGCSSQDSLNVPINAGPATPTITPTPATLCANVAGNTASGPAATTWAWSISNGTITSATNIQTITYTAGASGNVGLTLVVTNASGCSASNSVNVPINPIPTLSPGAGALTMGTYNTPYSQPFTPGGGTGPYTVALLSGTLPNGITLGGTTLSGTPIEPGGVATGNFSFTLRVTDTATGCLKDFAYTLYVQPKAVADSCTGVGNTQLMGGGYTPAPGTPYSTSCNGALANDQGPGALSAVVSGIPVNGTVSLNSNGTYLFTPNLSATSGSFNYTLTDGNGATATGSVTLTFSGKVWYVNAGYGGTSDGRSHQPFKTVNAAQSPSGTGDTIFVHSGGSFPTSDTIALKTNQTLWGQGTAYTLGNLTIGASSKPTLTGTVTLETGVTVSSLDVTPNPGSQTGITDPVGAISGVTIKNGVAVTTTTGTAVSFTNLDSTAGGSPNFGINFLSVSANGGSNGISLTNVNVTTGTFTVLGNGSAGTGGTIQHMFGADGAVAGSGVYLSNAKNISLSWMQLNDFQNHAIRGLNVTGFTLANTVISGVNGTDASGDGEGSIYFDGLFGTGSISSSTISGALVDNVHISNTSGTLTSFTVSGSTIRDNSSGSGNVGIQFLSKTTANMTATVQNSSFHGNRTVALRGDAGDSSTLNVTFTGNTIVAGSPNQGNQGIEISKALTSTVTFVCDGNKVGTPDGTTNQALGNTGINIFSGATAGSMTGTVKNNIVINAGAGISGFGIRVFNSNLGSMNVNVANNTVSNVGLDYGILCESSGAASPGGLLAVALTGNTSNVLAGALDAMRVQARNSNQICAKVSGNSSTSAGTGFVGLTVRQANTAVFSLEGLALGSQTAATTQTYVAGQNPGVIDTVQAIASTNFTGVSTNSCSITP